jgi:molybdopterin-guanine dinucleotide biosynthesis protein A
MPPECQTAGVARILGRDLGVIVLTGGGGTRLGGVDKAGLVLGGRSLLDRALDLAAAVGEHVVVVGPRAQTARPVQWTREDPPGGGPAAALLAGARVLDTAWVLALAVDMPLVTPVVVTSLCEAAGPEGNDGSLLVDAGGRRQPLCGVYRRQALLAAAPDDPHGLPVHRLVAELRLAEVAARDGESGDVDTPEQLDRLRALLEG